MGSGWGWDQGSEARDRGSQPWDQGSEAKSGINTSLEMSKEDFKSLNHVTSRQAKQHRFIFELAAQLALTKEQERPLEYRKLASMLNIKLINYLSGAAYPIIVKLHFS